MVRSALEGIRSSPRNIRHLALAVSLVGAHSLLLGTFVFCFTRLFYRLFFRTEIENLFFVRQTGLFLVCLGMFYFVPLLDLPKRHRLVMIIILTKVLAVLSLVANAAITPAPAIMLATAAGDGAMACLLAFCYHRARLGLTESEVSRESGAP
jgi:hypothetical protein